MPSTRPTLLKLRLGVLQGRHSVRSCHRAVDGHRPEPAQIVGTATGLVDATDLPAAGGDGVVRPVLVDPGAEAGRTSLRFIRYVEVSDIGTGQAVDRILRMLNEYFHPRGDTIVTRSPILLGLTPKPPRVASQGFGGSFDLSSGQTVSTTALISSVTVLRTGVSTT